MTRLNNIRANANSVSSHFDKICDKGVVASASCRDERVSG